MNIKRALRIAQEQPWFESFKKYTISYSGNFEKFLSKMSGDYLASNFISKPFIWSTTKEGQEYWNDVCDDFVKKYYDRSAKLINAAMGDEQRFVSTLKDTGICYDSVVQEGKDLVAYKNIYKIEEE